MLKKLRKADVPKPLKKLAAPEPSVLVRGDPDLAFPGCVLVPAKRAPKSFPKLNLKYNFPETYYRYDRKKRAVRCIVTVMPDGSRVAWDTCSYCHHYFTMCTCTAGIQTCRSVEYIHDSIEARVKGEEWGMSHRNYRGSLTREERERRQAEPQRFVMPPRASVPPRTTSRPAAGSTAPQERRILSKLPPQKTVKPLLSKKTEREVQAAVASSDLSKLHGAAEQLSDALEAKLLGKGRKPILKKIPQQDQPVKKKLIRKATK